MGLIVLDETLAQKAVSFGAIAKLRGADAVYVAVAEDTSSHGIKNCCCEQHQFSKHVRRKHFLFDRTFPLTKRLKNFEKRV